MSVEVGSVMICRKRQLTSFECSQRQWQHHIVRPLQVHCDTRGFWESRCLSWFLVYPPEKHLQAACSLSHPWFEASVFWYDYFTCSRSLFKLFTLDTTVKHISSILGCFLVYLSASLSSVQGYRLGGINHEINPKIPIYIDLLGDLCAHTTKNKMNEWYSSFMLS